MLLVFQAIFFFHCQQTLKRNNTIPHVILTAMMFLTAEWETTLQFIGVIGIGQVLDPSIHTIFPFRNTSIIFMFMYINYKISFLVYLFVSFEATFKMSL